VLGYSIQSKGVIPGNSGELGTNWAVIVAREYGQRPKHVNDVDVKTEEAFHCPERERYQPQPFVDYVVNALTPEGPNPGGVHTGFRWDPLPEWHRIDRYKRSSETVYILDAEREDRVPHKDPKAKPAPDWPRGPSVHAARVNWYDGDYDLGALDIMDVRTGSHLPQGKNGSNVSDAIGYRRAARKMHLDRYTNAVYFDGHAAGELIVNLGSDIDNYGHWLRLFGIKDVETAKQIHMD
jgi:prepilin-type processing-associated H-X9-DG protein